MTKAIGFIGLGVMGFPMAGHLSKKYQVSVLNRSIEKTNNWVKKYDGIASDSLKDITLKSEVLILCVGNDDDVRNIVCGKNGILDYAKPGTIIIDHTTTSSDLPIELNKLLNEKNVNFIDAPISGGEAGAQSGQLSIMVGGDKESFEQIKSVLKTYSKFTKLMGTSGSGQLTKMVNQICIAGLLQGLAEAMNFSDKVGLETDEVIEVISKGAAQSWQMENRWQTMLNDNFNHGFAVDLMRKDLDIVINKAKDSNINLDVTRIVNECYKDIQKAGGGRWDTSSLYKRLKDII
jgi:3-hydroxyisobutyrate dehydrogenase-like beta-hydroxyacid dehydrogenase